MNHHAEELDANKLIANLNKKETKHCHTIYRMIPKVTRNSGKLVFTVFFYFFALCVSLAREAHVS